MGYSNLSVVITAADVQAISAALDTLNAKLPFLINLTEEERRDLVKMGSKSVDYVQDSKDVVKTFPTIFPPSFNQDEFAKDADAWKTLLPIKMRVDAFKEKLDDTIMALGSESMIAALEVYALVKAQSDKVPGLKSVEEKLKDRFKKSKHKVADTKEVEVK